jgi:hypothetical protein
MDLQHCEELVVGLADSLADAYPLGRPPGETFDEVQCLSRNVARDYVKSIGGCNDDIEDIAAAMMKKFHHRYSWLTESMSTRLLTHLEPRGNA